MYYCFKELDLDMDNTPYDDSLTDEYVAEYEATLPEGDNSITEIPGYSDSALFEELED